MTVGDFTHDGQIQTIDVSKREFRTDRGVEFNFRDSWMFNVAAYKIDRLIGLNLVPPASRVPTKARTAPLPGGLTTSRWTKPIDSRKS